MEKLEFQCCFCGETIVDTVVDPCAVLLVGNWQSPDPTKQAKQQFSFHVTCFKKAVWRNIPVEIEMLVEDHLEESRGAS